MNLLIASAWARKEIVLHSFGAAGDGAEPYAGLVIDKEGNLFGTNITGGAYNWGTVFKVTPSGEESVLYSFCAESNCTDGQYPQAGVVLDKDGNLFGTTADGGAYDGGTVFEVTPSGQESVLYSFCPGGNPCTDGAGPVAALVFDKKGNLYGTTQYGGAGSGCRGKYGCGTVFKLTPSGHESVLYSFCKKSKCADGAYPLAALILDKKGNLYGTTYGGGVHCADGCGTVFKVTRAGKESVLHTFCRQGGKHCADGFNPYAALVFDRQGNLYGTTGSGGGTVFRVTPSGKESILYRFGGRDDGSSPYAGLVFGEKGNLYGTTYAGGGYHRDSGVVFKLTPSGEEVVLHTFGGGVDGAYPYAGVVLDKKENLFGTTTKGGTYGLGTVFEVVP